METIDFSEEFNNNVFLTISKQNIDKLFGMNFLCFYEVIRYRRPKYFIDYESIASIDYAKASQNNKIERVTGRLIENNKQYDQEELTYLLLRHLVNFSWKLDLLFLLHLEQCLRANTNWGSLLRTVAMEEKIMNGQPYWLRNAQAGLFNDADPELKAILNKVELVMVKSNMIFPKYSSLGREHNKHYFIQIDSGIYPFLFEWMRILLSGYRVNQFNLSNRVVNTSEPVKTGSKLMFAVAKIIRRGGSAFSLPEPALSFSNEDFNII